MNVESLKVGTLSRSVWKDLKGFSDEHVTSETLSDLTVLTG